MSVTRVSRNSPTDITSGAQISQRRGPSRSASLPNRGARKNMTRLIGRKISDARAAS